MARFKRKRSAYKKRSRKAYKAHRRAKKRQAKIDTSICVPMYIADDPLAIPAQGIYAKTYHWHPIDFQNWQEYADMFTYCKCVKVQWEYIRIDGNDLQVHLEVDQLVADYNGTIQHVGEIIWNTCMPQGWEVGPATTALMKHYSSYKRHIVHPHKIYKSVLKTIKWVDGVAEGGVGTAEVTRKSGWFPTNQHDLWLQGPALCVDNHFVDNCTIILRQKAWFRFKGVHI
nr:MAG: putative capsid protein [Arizlama virus]